MNKKGKKLSAWFYGLGVLVILAGFGLTAVLLIQGVKELPSSLRKAYDLNRLSPVVVPGSADLTLARSGAYAVYYEYRAMVDGKPYINKQTPPTLRCSLTSKTSGREIPVVPDFVDSNRYSGGGASYEERREGVLIMSSTLKTPGVYTFSCWYPGGEEEPKVVVSLGQNIAWEVMQALLRTAKPLSTGLALICGSGMAAILITAVVGVARHQRESFDEKQC